MPASPSGREPAATGGLNRLVLAAQLTERAPLRYTPAGLPVADVRLTHQGQASEAGVLREVKLELRAVAIGPISQPVLALELGATRSFAGFLAAARNGKGLVFHIQEFADA